MGRCCVRILGVMLLAGLFVAAGCKQKRPAPQPEKTAAVTEEAERAAAAEKAVAEKAAAEKAAAVKAAAGKAGEVAK